MPNRKGRGTGSAAEPTQLLDEITKALQAEHPLDLLALASTLAAGLDRTEVEEALGGKSSLPSPGELLGMFVESGEPPMQAMAWTVAHLLPDELLRAKVLRAVDRRRLPPWLAELGSATVQGAWQTLDSLRDGSNVVLGLSVGGFDLTVVGFLDFNNAGALKDAFVVPLALPEFQATWRKLTPGAGIEARDLSPADARAWLAEALETGSHFWPPFTSDSWPQARPLVEWALRLCPPDGAGWDRPTWSRSDSTKIIRRFLGSAAGRRFDDPVHRSLLDVILRLGADYGWGDPLLLSATKIEMMLLDLVPRKILYPVDELELLPDLLRAFIPYAHRTRGVAPEDTATATDALLRHSRAYLELIADDDAADDQLDSYANFGEIVLDQLSREVGGPAALDALDDRPLPTEDLDLSEVPTDIQDRVLAIDGLVESACATFFDNEFRTAVRRLLHDAAVGDPMIFRRRASDHTAAAALCWMILRTNDQIPGPLNQDLMAHFGIKGSVSQRATTFRRAVLGPTSTFDSSGPWGHTRYLTGPQREAMIRSRDRWRAEN